MENRIDGVSRCQDGVMEECLVVEGRKASVSLLVGR